MISIFKKVKTSFLHRYHKYINKTNYIKSPKKYSLLIYDDMFPHPRSGFRYEEIKVLLDEFKNSKIILEPTGYTFIKDDIKFHAEHLKEFITKNPNEKKKLTLKKRIININTTLFYCIFLNNIYKNLDWIEKHKIPFVFTLYPGGGFMVHNKHSDYMLKKVTDSNQFKGVIVSQLFTKNYLIDNNFCKADQINYIFGCVVPQDSLNKRFTAKKLYPEKSTFDIVFCATKYMPKGEDKGYDIFIELANVLTKKYDFIRFHVIGGFNNEDISVDSLGDSITFYGYQNFSHLTAIYQKMDVILSPNRPFILNNGRFDGFPLGTVIEAVFNGVVAIVTDELKQNTVFDNYHELIITKPKVESFEEEIIKLIENPINLKNISNDGRVKFLKIYSNSYQMKPRINMLKSTIEQSNFTSYQKKC